jgi:hypothetical protein
MRARDIVTRAYHRVIGLDKASFDSKGLTVVQHIEIPDITIPWSKERFHACNLLETAGVGFAVYLEDLLVLHGSDTVVFDLNLLVVDLDNASRVLQKTGYQEVEADSGLYFIPPDLKGIRLRRIMTGSFVTILSSQLWRYQSELRPLPAIHDFLNSMMQMWPRIPVSEYGTQLEFALHVFCWIGYCYQLTDTNGLRVKSVEYADCLQPEHRELHYDLIEEGDLKKRATSGNAGHRYHVRRAQEILEGNFNPQPRMGTLFHRNFCLFRNRNRLWNSIVNGSLNNTVFDVCHPLASFFS